MIVAIVIVVLVVLIALWAVGIYNGLIKLRNLVQEAWRQIDVELKRRHDLIGNLVETVKGYAAHERGTLEDVMKARSQAMAGGQSPAQQAQSEGLLSAALGRLIAVAEAYPDLKANQNFLALQAQLEGTENRIAVARRDYIQAVRDYNLTLRTFPSVLWATFWFRSNEPFANFTIEEDKLQTPKVDFGTKQGG